MPVMSEQYIARTLLLLAVNAGVSNAKALRALAREFEIAGTVATKALQWLAERGMVDRVKAAPSKGTPAYIQYVWSYVPGRMAKRMDRMGLLLRDVAAGVGYGAEVVAKALGEAEAAPLEDG